MNTIHFTYSTDVMKTNTSGKLITLLELLLQNFPQQISPSCK